MGNGFQAGPDGRCDNCGCLPTECGCMVCESCGGSGWIRDERYIDEHECGHCEGDGIIV